MFDAVKNQERCTVRSNTVIVCGWLSEVVSAQPFWLIL